MLIGLTVLNIYKQYITCLRPNYCSFRVQTYIKQNNSAKPCFELSVTQTGFYIETLQWSSNFPRYITQWLVLCTSVETASFFWIRLPFLQRIPSRSDLMDSGGVLYKSSACQPCNGQIPDRMTSHWRRHLFTGHFLTLTCLQQSAVYVILPLSKWIYDRFSDCYHLMNWSKWIHASPLPLPQRETISRSRLM